MADYARKTGGAWVLLDGDFEIGGYQFASNWLDLSTPAERAEWRIKEILPPDSPPADHVVVGDRPEIVDHDGSPKYRHVTAPA